MEGHCDQKDLPNSFKTMPQVRRVKISIAHLEAVEILVGLNKFMEATYPTMVQDLGNR